MDLIGAPVPCKGCSAPFHGSALDGKRKARLPVARQSNPHMQCQGIQFIILVCAGVL